MRPFRRPDMRLTRWRVAAVAVLVEVVAAVAWAAFRLRAEGRAGAAVDRAA